MMAWDAAAGQLILFGGTTCTNPDSCSAVSNQTWEWSGTTWTQLNPPHSPPARAGASVAYDPASKRLVLFGGYDGSRALADTWTWNGTTWSQAHRAMSPPARDDASMAWDTKTKQMVLFGGDAGSDPVAMGGTWQWAGNTWTQLNPGTSPSARNSASMAWDSASGQLVLFGGDTDYGTTGLADTWT